MIKEALRLKLEAGLSHEQTARALRISKGVVAKYVGLAAAAGLSHWDAVCDLHERALQARLLGRGPAHADVVMPDFARIHRELSRKGVTLMLLWQEYVASHAGERTWGHTQFFEHYRAYAHSLKRPPSKKLEGWRSGQRSRDASGDGRWPAYADYAVAGLCRLRRRVASPAVGRFMPTPCWPVYAAR